MSGIQDHFSSQANICERMGSPFTARLLYGISRNLSSDTAVGRRLMGWPSDPGTDALGLRVAGALHALVLDDQDDALKAVYPPSGDAQYPDDLWVMVEQAFVRHERHILSWLDSPPQTNEVARAGIIMPALAVLSERFDLPLALYEIGTSAGLTLQLMDFRYRYGDQTVGNARSPVLVRPEVRSPLPIPAAMPHVASRMGCDLNPLDPRNPQQALRLRGYVWPDQRDRHERMSGAMALFRDNPPDVRPQDAATWVPERLAHREEGRVHVFFHTVVWQYLPPETQAGIVMTFERAGQAATPTGPVVLLGMEGHGSPVHTRLEMRVWSGKPGDGNTCHLANADYHGRWIDWIRAENTGS